MRYTSGTLGRVFVIRFDDGEVIVKAIEQFCRNRKITAAICFFIGALKDGEMAAGPKKPVIPPQPNWVSFRDGWEAMGIATVFSGKKGPQAHIHSSMGKSRRVLTGCVRKESKVFLVLEAVLLEIRGVHARKDLDPLTGLNLLSVGA